MKPHYKRRNGGYTPIKTVPAKPKRRKNKKHSFEAKQQPANVVLEGMKIEKINVICKFIFAALMLIAGFVLAIMDVRDQGMLFEGFGFKYSGSLSGIILALVGGFIALNAYPKIKLE